MDRCLAVYFLSAFCGFAGNCPVFCQYRPIWTCMCWPFLFVLFRFCTALLHYLVCYIAADVMCITFFIHCVLLQSCPTWRAVTDTASIYINKEHFITSRGKHYSYSNNQSLHIPVYYMLAIGGGRGQWLGGTMASAEHEPITGVWGQSPQRGPGAEPLKLKAFWSLDVQQSRQI